MNAMNKETAMNFCESSDSTRARLITDVKAVIADPEAYLNASVGQAGEAYTAARTKLAKTLDTAKARVAETRVALTGKTRAAAQATDVYVHERPWESIAVGAGVGLLLGWIIARR